MFESISVMQMPNCDLDKILETERVEGSKYRSRLRKSMVASLALHSFFVLAASTFTYFHHSQQHETTEGSGEGLGQATMVNVSQLPAETQNKESGSLPPMVIYNPKAVLGPETQDTNPNKKSDRDRLLDGIISPNFSLEEKLRDVILAGKSPNELYTHTNSPGEKDTMDYTEFFLVYLKKYFELKLDSSLLGPGHVYANKIDLRITFLATIAEDGQISIQCTNQYSVCESRAKWFQCEF